MNIRPNRVTPSMPKNTAVPRMCRHEDAIATRRKKSRTKASWEMLQPSRAGFRLDNSDAPMPRSRFWALFQPFTAVELKEIRERCRPFAADGRYEPFKMSTKDVY